MQCSFVLSFQSFAFLDVVILVYITIFLSLDALNTKEEAERNFLLMGIAYAANIGGTGVITGG